MTKYSSEIVEQIIRLIEVGNYAIDACLAVGIGEATYYQWLKKEEFRESIKKARAKAISTKVTRIHKAGQDGSWQADAWWLERVARKRFGRDEPQMQQQTQIVLGYKPESAFIQPVDKAEPKQLNSAQMHTRKTGEIMGKKKVIDAQIRGKPIRPRKKR